MSPRPVRATAIAVAAVLTHGCATAAPAPEEEVHPLPRRVSYRAASRPSGMPTRGALEASLGHLLDQVISSLVEGQKRAIAVVGFSDESGGESPFGRFLAEELTTRLFVTRRFTVVERRMLRKILDEQKLETSQIIDPASAKQIGRLLGVDAIATGTYTRLGGEMRVNARLIGTQDGLVFGAAATTILLDDDLAALVGGGGPRPATRPVPPRVVEPARPARNGLFLYEDFSRVRDGMVPDGWVGGEKMMAGSDGRQRFLRDFEHQDSHRLTIDNVAFSDDFELEYVFRFGNDYSFTHQTCILAGVTITIDVAGWYEMNNSKVERNRSHSGKAVLVKIRKEGPIWRLFIDGDEVLRGRYPAVHTPRALTLEFHNMTNFRLVRIAGRALGGE